MYEKGIFDWQHTALCFLMWKDPAQTIVPLHLVKAI